MISTDSKINSEKQSYVSLFLMKIELRLGSNLETKKSCTFFQFKKNICCFEISHTNSISFKLDFGEMQRKEDFSLSSFISHLDHGHRIVL